MNAHSRSPEHERIVQYIIVHGDGAELTKFLGDGTDGEVWATSRRTAVKAFKRDAGYENERDTYNRLAEHGVTTRIAGFSIPKMTGYDDDLRVIEMDLMLTPPYIIDFAKVRLNSGPDFSEQTLAENDAHGQFLFGKNWPSVKFLMAELESYLIFYLDPKPHNIVFPNTADEGESDEL
jgi:hypothetical protein